jgi:hypothetical protein
LPEVMLTGLDIAAVFMGICRLYSCLPFVEQLPGCIFIGLFLITPRFF